MENTTITVSKDTQKQLMLFKLHINAKNLDEVIKIIMDKIKEELDYDNNLELTKAINRRANITDALFKKQDNKCNMCHKSLEEHGWNIDHIIPKSIGGSHKMSNLQILCTNCHLRIKSKTDMKKIWKYKKDNNIPWSKNPEISEVCKFCGTIISGFSRSQVNSRMNMHQKSIKCKEKRDDLQTKNTL